MRKKKERARNIAQKHYYGNHEAIRARQTLYRENVKSKKTKEISIIFKYIKKNVFPFKQMTIYLYIRFKEKIKA